MEFTMAGCARRALTIYQLMTKEGFSRRQNEDSFWSNAIRSIQAQWGLAKNFTHATGAFISFAPENTDPVHKLEEINK